MTRTRFDGVEFSIIADVDASEWIDGENELWKYLVANASFAHREECEFIVHLHDGDLDHAAEMDLLRQNGGDDALVALLSQLRRAGARRVLLHA